MEIVAYIFSFLGIIALSVIIGYYFGQKKGYDKGFKEASSVPDSDRLTKEEKEQIRQVITVLSWDGK